MQRLELKLKLKVHNRFLGIWRMPKLISLLSWMDRNNRESFIFISAQREQNLQSETRSMISILTFQRKTSYYTTYNIVQKNKNQAALLDGKYLRRTLSSPAKSFIMKTGYDIRVIYQECMRVGYIFCSPGTSFSCFVERICIFLLKRTRIDRTLLKGV